MTTKTIVIDGQEHVVTVLDPAPRCEPPMIVTPTRPDVRRRYQERVDERDAGFRAEYRLRPRPKRLDYRCL